jgi:tRNA-splicing endonuclease subunit Sen34
MAPSAAQNTVEEPFPISRVADRYLLFNIDVISHCRRNHNICGMLVGTIPNLSQQNVFLGIPVELMPEEARVLVERGAAYIVDDAEAHKKTFKDMSREDRLKWLEEMDRRGHEVTRGTEELKEMRKDKALKEKGLNREVLEKKEEGVAGEVPIQAASSHSSDSGLGFIMKGSNFTDSSSLTSTPKLSRSSSASSGSGLGFIMKGSGFLDTLPVASKPKEIEPTSETSLFEPEPVAPAPPVVNGATPKGPGA